jgi:hypothetical protein
MVYCSLLDHETGICRTTARYDNAGDHNMNLLRHENRSLTQTHSDHKIKRENLEEFRIESFEENNTCTALNGDYRFSNTF